MRLVTPLCCLQELTGLHLRNPVLPNKKFVSKQKLSFLRDADRFLFTLWLFNAHPYRYTLQKVFVAN
ncbi:hypothetical protein FHC77_13415 [Atlantibacter hermannii]|uniref:hypothetical protein n=1 Tax=Atlantibacter hermannii TaxID=565 RepID=UPI001C703CC9|nr:hypothetical protein [Atlantibacter hermannii]MBW9431731.1 hypothetical protein [Atlantibacter hermannii]